MERYPRPGPPVRQQFGGRLPPNFPRFVGPPGARPMRHNFNPNFRRPPNRSFLVPSGPIQYPWASVHDPASVVINRVWQSRFPYQQQQQYPRYPTQEIFEMNQVLQNMAAHYYGSYPTWPNTYDPAIQCEPGTSHSNDLDRASCSHGNPVVPTPLNLPIDSKPLNLPIEPVPSVQAQLTHHVASSSSVTRTTSISETSSTHTERTINSTSTTESEMRAEIVVQVTLINSTTLSYWKYYQSYTPLGLLSGNIKVYSHLTNQIWMMHTSMQCSMGDFISRMKLWRKLLEIINQQTVHIYKVHLMGSTLSGLAISGSDLDFCIVTVQRETLPRKFDKMFHLENIRRQLNNIKEIGSINIIPAREPLLRFTAVTDRIYKIDMICNNVSALWSTKLILEYTKCDWRFQPISSVIKKWARFNEMNAPLKQTFSNYSISLMIIYYLQHGVSPAVLPCLHQQFGLIKGIDYIDPMNDTHPALTGNWSSTYKSTNEQSLGELLEGFFKFYSEFNFESSIITVRFDRLVTREELGVSEGMLVIEEPFTRINLGSNISSLKKITSIFDVTYKKLSQLHILEHLFI